MRNQLFIGKNPMPKIQIRCASDDDADQLQSIRAAAFAPVFASFRSILGDMIYEHAQAAEDQAQEEMLTQLLEPESIWELYVAELEKEIVGFVEVRFDTEQLVGEIGLNAVSPGHSGKGIGTQMYAFAVTKMKERGMKVATVATGGDPSHAPARKAYRKAGFDVQIPSVWMCRTL